LGAVVTGRKRWQANALTENEFGSKKNEMILTMPAGSDRKQRDYEVAAMNPANPITASPA